MNSFGQRLIGWAVVCTVCFLAAGTARAQQDVQSAPSGATDPLVSQVQQWMDRFQPISPEEVEAKKRRALEAASQLQSYLARGGQAVVQGWNRYLRWEVFEREMAKQQPDLQALNQVLQQLYADTPGVERVPFREFRSALHAFMNASLVAATPAMADQYRSQLNALAEAIVKYRQQDTPENAEAVGRILGWLEDAGQAADLVSKVRSEFCKPNFWGVASARLAQASASEPIDEVMPLQDCILGTSIQGNAHTVGQVHLELIPSEEAAALAIRLVGTANSNNVGNNRGVLIYSTGQTALDVRKEIRVDSQGIHLAPAEAQCETSTQITGVWHRLCVVRKIAWQQANRKKPQAEQVANARAELRAAQQMDQRTEELLDSAQRDFAEKFRNPLLRRGEFPRLMQFVSTTDQLALTLLQANASQLAAPSDPPQVPSHLDLAVRVHESFVGNFSEATIGGYTLTDERLVQLLEENNRQVPEELRIDPSKDPWSITFAQRQPIRVEFRDQKMKITIRGRQFTRGNQTVTAEMDIWAVYRVEQTAEGVKLTREGDVQAEYTRGGFESAARIAVKTLMRKKFEALFTPEFAGEGIELPRRQGRSDAQPPLRLKLAHLDVAHGWLAMGWKLERPPQTASHPHSSADAQVGS